jgi:hypothetical protein
MNKECYYFCSKYNNIEELSIDLLNEICSLVQNNVVFFCKQTYDKLSCSMKISLFNDRNIVYKISHNKKSKEEKQNLYILDSDLQYTNIWESLSSAYEYIHFVELPSSKNKNDIDEIFQYTTSFEILNLVSLEGYKTIHSDYPLLLCLTYIKNDKFCENPDTVYLNICKNVM